jgi:hypothetical protein
MTTPGKVQDEALQLIEKADYLRQKYLRASGWEYTSSTPNCYWMWCKVWQGKQWTYHDAEAALRAEAWMREFPDASGVSGRSTSHVSPSHADDPSCSGKG